MIGPVSAVLLSYKRPWHIPEIVAHLRGHMQIFDITIWCNDHPPQKELLQLEDVRLFGSGTNECTLGRFKAAMTSLTEHIFIQDDDLIVESLPQLIDAYDGTRILSYLADDESSKHWQFWQRGPKPYVELGFGSIFPRAWARQYLEMKWTDDEELRRRKSDKAFTILFPWEAMRAGPDDLTRLTHDGLESGRDANALYKRFDHDSLTQRAVAAALAYKATRDGASS